MLTARRLGAVVLIVAALAVWFTMKPTADPASSTDFQSAISGALAADKLNQSTSQYSSQQAVANGWVARDLLEIIAKEQNAALSPQSTPRDNRVPAELMLLVLGVGLLALTTVGPLGATPFPGSTGPAPVVGPEPTDD